MSRRSRTRRKTGQIHQAPFGQVERRMAPLEILSTDEVERIHEAALTILARIGIKVLEPGAHDRLRQAGAEVEGDMVRFPQGMIAEHLRSVPQEFTLIARNPAHNLRFGGGWHVFASVGGPAYVMDNEGGRRDGTYDEMCDFLRLVQALNIIHQEGGCPFEPLDLPAHSRHLDIYLAQITLLDKNWQTQTLGRPRTMDGIEMAALGLGLSVDELAKSPTLLGIINTNSPLQIDIPMGEGLVSMAEHGQVNVITPFTLAGAMSPVTLAGALAQQHAEAMAGIALTQIVRPGVPVMYGGFTSNVDMRSGAPAFGTPEYVKAALISGQLARHIGVPFRSSNVCAANEVDAQAAYESQMALWGALMGGAHLVEHAAGWLHGGLTASFEKLILDAEMLAMMEEVMRPVAVTDETLAFETMEEVGPGGHFFGTDHTMARYETAFHAPMLSNWENHPQWLENGAVQSRERANVLWKQLLAEHEDPPFDPARREALDDYVARRKAEGGAPMV